jgi:succinoglycan biosynthesis transport protein ExoP
MMEFGRRRLNGPEQLDEGLGIRVLGSLPSVSARKAMGAGSTVAAQLSESIDNVRATLMHDSTSQKRQVILISSPVTMEGSTTVASHLALSLTRAGRRTLLVDGDVREPSLHKLFGMPLGDGLCEVLRSETDVTDAIRATNTEGLWLLTAGQCDMDAVHALATDQPQPIVDKLREEFDFIIIDGAPILGLSDTLSLGQYVDGAILTVLRDHSEIRKVYQAAELLKSLGIRLIGTVVNGVPIKTDRRVTRLHRQAAKQPRKLPAEAAS